MQSPVIVIDRQFSFTFCFRFEKLIFCCLPHVTLWRLSLFFILLLFDSSVFAKHSVYVLVSIIQHVMCPMHTRLLRFC